MIPESTISSTPVPDVFVVGARITPLNSKSLGGVDLSDVSQGTSSYLWNGSVKEKVITINNSMHSYEVFETDSDPVFFDFAFTQNNSPVLSWMDESGSYIRFYDSTTESDVTMKIPDAVNPCVKLDDPREDQSTISDVILSYQKVGDSSLYIRYQRDRYSIEHKLSEPMKGFLKQAGMMNNNRFGWAFTNDREFNNG